MQSGNINIEMFLKILMKKMEHFHTRYLRKSLSAWALHVDHRKAAGPEGPTAITPGLPLQGAVPSCSMPSLKYRYRNTRIFDEFSLDINSS